MPKEDEQPVEQPVDAASAETAQAPAGQEAASQVIKLEGREFTPGQLAESYSELHREFTKATQERNTFARVLQDFGLLDDGEPEQAATPAGYEQPGYGVGQSANPTTQRPASAPYGNAPQAPIETQGLEPALPDRVEAIEATMERLMFGRRHPELDDGSIDRLESLRSSLERKFGIPHRLESVWAEMIVEDSKLRYARQQGQQVRQESARQVQDLQRQAAQSAPQVIPGSGNPAMQPPPPARTVDEVVARLAGQAAEEMAGLGQE